MDDNAWVVQTLAGACFVAAGIPLLRLASRSGQFPERVLGWTFLLMGISYGFYQLPLIFSGLAPLEDPFAIVGRLAYAASVVAVAFFTREVFRKGDAWARWLPWGCVALIAGGVCISGFYGDLEGLAPLSNPGFWIEWTGEIIPCFWVGIEGLIQYRKSGRRMQFGLSDPTVTNRFLLWSLFGFMQVATLVVLAPMNIEYEMHGRYSATMDALEGAFEMLTIAMIWLAFFPPALYRSWIARAGQPGSAGAS